MHEMSSDVIGTMVRWIDEHLNDALTLDVIARRAGYSPFHFSRMFLAETRRSVMAYVRGRRLVRGAKRLLSEPRLRLIDLSFDCGFDSPEAFTRAFKRMFGTTPARFREGFAVEPLEGQFPMQTAFQSRMTVERLPEFAARGRLLVTGPSRRFDDDTKSEIPQLWSRLIGALPFEAQVNSRATYGVISLVDRAEATFQYTAGVEVTNDHSLPAGFKTVAIEPAVYAVFRIVLDGGPVHLQIKAAMSDIWGRHIPESGLTLTEGPDFELYDGEKPLTEAGAVVDFYIPVRP